MRTMLLAIGVALAALVSLFFIQRGSVGLTLVVGIAIAAVGLPLVIVSRRQLGPAFAVTAQAKGLVTTGLYAKIPHPMYAFLDLTVLGAVIALRQVWLLVLWCGLVGVQMFEAHREARALAAVYGDRYLDYRRQTWW
jgi:protein-S-isoprenylcysteine O-methyltransferase Ste14